MSIENVTAVFPGTEIEGAAPFPANLADLIPAGSGAVPMTASQAAAWVAAWNAQAFEVARADA